MDSLRKSFYKYKWRLILSSAFSISSTILWVYFAMIMSQMVDSISSNNSNIYLKLAIKAVIYIASVRTLSYLYKKTLSQYSNKTTNYIREKFLKYDYSRKRINKPAEEIAILTNDLNIIKQNLCDNVPAILSNFVSIILSSVLLIKLNLIITIVIYAIVILALFFPIMMKKIIEKKQLVITSDNAHFFNSLEDDFSGFDVAKSYGITQQLFAETRDISEDLSSNSASFEILSCRIEEIMHFFVTLLGTIGFILGSYFVMMHSLTYGEMIAIVQLTNTLATPLNQISGNISKFMGGRAVLKKLEMRYLSDETEESAPDPNFVKINSIKLENLSFAIGNDIILDNINYEFRAGKKYLLEGQSGSGKTTLLKIMSLAEDRYTGRVLVNDVDIRTMNRKVLSKYVLYIEQTPYIFDRSVIDNIYLFSEPDESKLKQVTDRLKISYLLEKNNDGNENLKSTLSGGEKQRISLSRGLYRAKMVYLLDEISASLDQKNTSIVENEIKKIKCDIVISVSHKINDKDKSAYDAVLKIDNRKLVSAS